MDKKKLINLIVAVVLALVAVFLVNAYLAQKQEELRKKVQTSSPDMKYERVVVATKHIPRGQKIDKEMLAFKKMPVNFIQPGAVSSANDVIGKIVLADILPEEQISTTKLTLADSAGPISTTLSMKTPSGKRAITISIDKLSAVGGMINPGDYVDVLGTFPVPQVIDGKQTTQLVTVTLFQNVLVLAVGSSLYKTTDEKGRTTTTTDASTITLALLPQEAGLISFAQEQGKLKLILRPPLDTSSQPLPVATWDGLLQHILQSQGIEMQAPTSEAAPEIPKEKARQVEIYRGQKKETIEIEK